MAMVWYAIVFTLLTVLLGVYTTLTIWKEPVYNKLTTAIIQINTLAAALHLSSALLILWISKDVWMAPIYVEITTWEYNATNDTSCAPCYIETTLHYRHTLNVMLLVVLAGITSGWMHLLSITLSPVTDLLRHIQSGKNYFRWIDYSVSASFMIIVIAVLCGIYNSYILLLMFFIQMSLLIYTILIEDDLAETYIKRKDGKRTRALWSLGFTALIYIICIWVPILVSFYRTVYYSPIETPYWVGIIVWVIFGIFCGFPVIMYKYLIWNKNGDVTTNMFLQELAYICLSFTAKLSLMWMLYSGVHSREQLLSEQSDANTVVPILAVVILLASVVLYIRMRRKLINILKSLPQTLLTDIH